MDLYFSGKQKGLFSHIVGIGLEGPLLASHGGTPHKGVWMPSKNQWQALSKMGDKGLIYSILSPDAILEHGNRFDPTGSPSSVNWIVETLLEGGVLPAPGHFKRDNPKESARCLQALFDVVINWGQGPTLTDHLFNDMPRNFKHAWRSKEDQCTRNEDILNLHLEEWNISNLEEKLGPVPATIINNARKGLVKVSQNFDGEHVDLAIVQKAVELIGAENMLMMTDSIESKRLAGRELTMKEGATLLYQDEGVVAAGSQGVVRQIQNMLSIGLTEAQIKLIVNEVPNLLSYKCENHYAETICL